MINVLLNAKYASFFIGMLRTEEKQAIFRLRVPIDFSNYFLLHRMDVIFLSYVQQILSSSNFFSSVTYIRVYSFSMCESISHKTTTND